MGKKVACPECGSVNCVLLGQDRKKISVTKGVIGAALLGPVGLAGALIGNKKGKYQFYCQDCGQRFDVK